jgi:hypothetical protein
MEIIMNLNGKKRKELVTAVGEALGCEPEYQKAPSYAYDIGGVVLDRENKLIFTGSDNFDKVQQLLEKLEEKGFTTESLPDRMTIQMPIDGFDDVAQDNLDKLIASKGELIKKALGIDELELEKTDEAIGFPWFAFDTPHEDIKAYSQFISALCEMAKKQKRVTSVEKSVENEKYAFRCFLLRLGFIGEEFSETRKVLLRNLTGNGSVKSDLGDGNGNGKKAKGVPKPEQFEAMAEAIANHLVRALFQYIDHVA